MEIASKIFVDSGKHSVAVWWLRKAQSLLICIFSEELFPRPNIEKV